MPGACGDVFVGLDRATRVKPEVRERKANRLLLHASMLPLQQSHCFDGFVVVVL